MPNNATSFSRNPVTDEPSSIGEKLSDTATQVTDKVADLGRTLKTGSTHMLEANCGHSYCYSGP
jgi:hypothetical protein